ncbi:hypothetical protein PFLU4_37680 [Pseudomonas fluorescens]|nr:hypothetical protein PFLU4_37680 [Pseudomonas fluorescens]
MVVHQHRIGVAVAGHAVVHSQRRGGIETLQLAAPELLGLARVLALQPLDVIAKRPRAFQLRRAVVAQRFVDFEEVHGHQGNAPGVHQDVVEAANELVGLIAQAYQPEANQRWLRQVEADFLLVFQQRADSRFLLMGGEPAQVEGVQRYLDLAMDHLHRLLLAFPLETGAQGRVQRHHLAPRFEERPFIDSPADAVAILHQVHTGVFVQQGVEQHPLLQRRQRVNVFDRVTGGFFGGH